MILCSYGISLVSQASGGYSHFVSLTSGRNGRVVESASFCPAKQLRFRKPGQDLTQHCLLPASAFLPFPVGRIRSESALFVVTKPRSIVNRRDMALIVD